MSSLPPGAGVLCGVVGSPGLVHPTQEATSGPAARLLTLMMGHKDVGPHVELVPADVFTGNTPGKVSSVF